MSQAPDDGATSARSEWALLGGGLALSLTIYLLRLDRVVGLFVDDAWYALLAKSLATGQGYQLINSPTPGILPLYPPGFPFLLSLLYRLSPDFPGNIWLLKMLSIAAMMGLGVAAYFYFNRHRATPRNVAAGLAVVAILCPLLVSMATSSLMSECVFTLLVMGQLLATERFARASRPAWAMLVLAAFLAALAFLTRSVAVGLIAGVFLYLLKEKMVRAALIFAALVALFAGPWTIYSRTHAPTTDQQLEQGGYILQPYQTQLWQRVAGVRSAGTITMADLPARAGKNINQIAGQDTLRILATPVFQWLRGPAEQDGGGLVVSYLLFLLVLLGFILAVREKLTAAEIAIPLMLGVIVLWPWETIRFVLPLAPFFFYYFVRGVGGLLQRLRPSAENPLTGKLIAGTMVLLLAASLMSHGSYLWEQYLASNLERPAWLMAFDDTEKLMEWIDKNIPKSETVIANNPALVNLYTGHRTISFELNPERWDYYRQKNIRYLVLSSYLGNPTPPGMRNYPAVYRVKNVQDFRVIDLGPGESRPPLE